MRFIDFINEKTLPFKKYCEEILNQITRKMKDFQLSEKKFSMGEHQLCKMDFFKYYDGSKKYNDIVKDWEKDILEFSNNLGKLSVTKGKLALGGEVELSGKTSDGFDVKLMTKMNDVLVGNRYFTKVLVEIKGNELTSAENFTVYKNIKPGTIYYISDGYNATIVTFYQVVRRTEKTIYLKEIKRKIAKSSAGGSGHCVPEKDKFISNNVIRTTIKDDTHAKIDGMIAVVWDGKPVYFSNTY